MSKVYSFDGIVGHRQVIESLKRILSDGRVTHAYVFSGPEGTGKRTAAQIFAGTLLCKNSDPAGRCGVCEVCGMLNENSCPDLRIIRGEAKSIGIDEIRELQSDIILRPVYSAQKVYIISNSEKMTVEAQNCLLKTLESPPEYSIIILTTSNYDSLLPTIKSRVVRLNFARNTKAEVERIIGDKLGEDYSLKGFLAACSDGSAGKAIRLSETEGLLEAREEIFKIIPGLQKGRRDFIIEKYPFFEEHKENINDVFNMMRLAYRDFLSAAVGSAQNGLINEDKKDIIFNNVDKLTAAGIIKNIEAIDEAEREIKFNANFENAVKVMLIKITEEKY